MGKDTSHASRKRAVPQDHDETPKLATRSRATSCHEHSDVEVVEPKPKKTKQKKSPVKGEKRLRRFRLKAPQNFDVVYERATSQRFYVLERTRTGTSECPEEEVELTGSTGNVYNVHVGRQPECSCPHNRKGHQCKHILYVMSRVLRARFDLVYQLAYISDELREIFESAPPIETGEDEETEHKNRKEIEGDCPICFMPFEGDGPDAIVFCRATCGQNMHKECFEMWAATKRKSARDKITCPFCRSPWEGDDDMVKTIKNTGIMGSEGYVNIADQLGISRVRDRSTYYDDAGEPKFRACNPTAHSGSGHA